MYAPLAITTLSLPQPLALVKGRERGDHQGGKAVKRLNERGCGVRSTAEIYMAGEMNMLVYGGACALTPYPPGRV